MHIIIRKLEEFSKTYLLNRIPIFISPNSDIITISLVDTFNKFELNQYKVLLLLSDSATYMKLAKKNKTVIPRMRHVLYLPFNLQRNRRNKIIIA